TNIDGVNASVSIKYYRDDGSLITTESFVLPSAGETIKQWKTIYDTFGVSSGSAWITSNNAVIIKPSQAVDVEGGLGFWSGYAYDTSGTKFYIPELVYLNDPAGTRSNFKLTNLGSATATVTITYLYLNGTVIGTKSDSLAAGGTKIYNWQTEVYNTYGITEGSAIVQSGQKLAVVAARARNTGADIDNYKGVPMDTAGMHIFAYGLKYGANSTSNLTISNMAGTASSVTLRFLDKNGAGITTISDTLAGGESKRYNWKALIYDVWGKPEGSVEITSNGQTAVLVSENLISPQGRLGYFGGEII
ncbi:MAG TPA: hypothetical protein VIO58_02165, partial [Candidatus Methanoperedens sp.]